ncbi:MAG: alpha/beta hydrolase [Saprospiraceae bacterium]
MFSKSYPVLYTSIQSQSIAYIDIGPKDGPCLLFVHGLGSNALCWLKNIEALSQRYRCIAPDLPGYGGSVSDNNISGIVEYADLLIQFISNVKASDTVLVGHSMGAQIGIHMYLRDKECLRGLVLIAPAGFETFNESEKFMLQSMNRPDLVQNLGSEQINQAFQANFKKLSPDMKFMIQDRIDLMADSKSYKKYLDLVSTNVQSMLNNPIFKELDEIAIPTLIIFGADDYLIPNRMLHPMDSTSQLAEKGRAKIANSSLEMIADAGHFVQWEQAEKVNVVIESWASKFIA